jgi:flagellar motor protein MotB
VTKTAFDELQKQHDETVATRDDLSKQVERLEVERDSFETQFMDAQESYEDERVTRTALAGDFERVQTQATQLDRDLEAERLARVEAAAALALRETELSSMQSTYDELVTDLESELSAGQIEIERLREGLRLNVSEDVLFASGSAQLDRIGRDVLTKVAGRL